LTWLLSALGVEKIDGKFLAGGMFICLLYAVTLDMKRQSGTLLLSLDRVFQKIVGLE